MLRDLVCVGISHHVTPLAVRERAVVEGDAVLRATHRVQEAGAREVVVLSTCNRTEVYFLCGPAPAPGPEAEAEGGTGAEAGGVGGGDGSPAGGRGPGRGRWPALPVVSAVRSWLQQRASISDDDAARYIYTHVGSDAARHLFRVVSGLDSLVLGEPQIQGQVKAAYEAAAGYRNGGPRAVGVVLARVFESALSVGARVRTDTKLGSGAGSVPSAAVELARKIFGSLKGRRTVILGAGEMSELTLQCMLAEGVAGAVVANRTEQRARDLVARHGGVATTFTALPELLADADIVACATAAPHHIITEQMVKRVFDAGRKEPILLLDIALPRDVDPVVGEIDGVFLYDVDDLKQVVEGTLALRRGEIEAATAIVDAGVAEIVAWGRARHAVPVIQALRGHAEAIRADEVARALRGMRLSEGDAAAVHAMTRQLLNKLLHEPTIALRRAAEEGREDEVGEAARYLFGLAPEEGEH